MSNAKASHFSLFFNRKYWSISDINIWNFKETLSHEVISFEQPGPRKIIYILWILSLYQICFWLFQFFNLYIFIRLFEKRLYYVIPLGVRPSVCPSVRPSICKLFRFRVTPPTVYVPLSWNLVYIKAMRWFNAYYLEVMVQWFLAELQPLIRFFSMFISG